jgi:L-fucose mutarotase/ribose pyranase (RbsD/FucU family)
MSEKHLSSQFDTDLTSISTKVLQMGGLVEAQIARAMRALANFDTAMCDQVMAVELEINALEIEIDSDCNNIIARRQPTARDLRLVMAISKTITNLERGLKYHYSQRRFTYSVKYSPAARRGNVPVQRVLDRKRRPLPVAAMSNLAMLSARSRDRLRAEVGLSRDPD